MRLTFILCFTSLFLGIRCGLIKNILGSVSDEVNKVSNGNIVENVVNVVHTETKGIVEDLGDLLQIKTNNKQNIGPTENDEDNKYEDVPNTVMTPFTTQTSTAKINTDENIKSNVSNNKDINIYPVNETTEVNEITDDDNHAVESTKISTDSTVSNTFVSIEEDYHYGEGSISPRIARQIKTKNALIQQETQNTIIDETNFPAVNENVLVDKITNQSTAVKINNFSDMVNINDVTTSPESTDVSNQVIGDCPEGHLLLGGLCIDTQGARRSNFVGGCFYGFARADDGTCQEVIYD